MIKWDLCRKPDKETWNKRVQSVPEGMIFQTTYWGDYIEASCLYKPSYLIARDSDNRVVASLLFYIAGFGQEAFRERPLSQFSIPLLRRVLPVLRWYYGPVVFDKSYTEEVYESLWAKIGEFSRVYNIYQVRHATLPIHGLDQSQIDSKKCMAASDYAVEIWATFIVDLLYPVEELWANLEGGRVRTPIRKVLKQNVIAKPIETMQELKQYHILLREARARLSLALPPAYPDETMWQIFYPNNCIQIFAGWQDGQMIAAVPVIIFNGILTLLAPAQSNHAYQNKIDVNDLLHWEIIKWGKENGYRFYDLAGVAPTPRNKKEEGIKRYKRKFGGSYIEYPKLTKTYSKLRASIINSLRRV